MSRSPARKRYTWKLEENGKLNVAGLKRWLTEMSEWAQIARIDIVRLEGAAHLAPGDPGDPPPPPEE